MAEYPEDHEQLEDIEETPHIKIRDSFPPADTNHLGGTSNGFKYRTVFGGSNLKHSYGLLKQFLTDEGYNNIPLPKDEKELKAFRHPASSKAIKLFEEYGYIHNPIKIFFHPHLRKENTLILYIYNEQADNHLLRFHGKLEEE